MQTCSGRLLGRISSTFAATKMNLRDKRRIARTPEAFYTQTEASEVPKATTAAPDEVSNAPRPRLPKVKATAKLSHEPASETPTPRLPKVKATALEQARPWRPAKLSSSTLRGPPPRAGPADTPPRSTEATGASLSQGRTIPHKAAATPKKRAPKTNSTAHKAPPAKTKGTNAT